MKTFLAAAWAALFCAPYAPAADDPLVAAARRREAEHARVDATITVTEFVAKGSVSTRTAAFKTAAKTIPADDVTAASVNRLLLDGSKVRVEFNHPLFQLETGALIRKPSLNVSDATTAKTLHGEGMGPSATPQGIILPNAEPNAIKYWIFTPVTLAVRGTRASFAPYPLQEFKPAGPADLAGVGRTAKYALGLSKDTDVELWADPAADYVIRRLRMTARGKNGYQFDIAYRGGLPAGWKRTEFAADGKVLSSAEITAAYVPAPAAPAAEQFDIEFPPGAKVADQRTRTDYVLDADGDRTDTRVNGMPVDPAAARAAKWYARWPYAAALVLVLVCVAVAVIRRRRKS